MIMMMVIVNNGRGDVCVAVLCLPDDGVDLDGKHTQFPERTSSVSRFYQQPRQNQGTSLDLTLILLAYLLTDKIFPLNGATGRVSCTRKVT